jgi:hypothetical protein
MLFFCLSIVDPASTAPPTEFEEDIAKVVQAIRTLNNPLGSSTYEIAKLAAPQRRRKKFNILRTAMFIRRGLLHGMAQGSVVPVSRSSERTTWIGVFTLPEIIKGKAKARAKKKPDSDHELSPPPSPIAIAHVLNEGMLEFQPLTYLYSIHKYSPQVASRES